jgi:hypothetical protein
MSRTGSDIDRPHKTLAFVRLGPFPICNRLLPKYLAAALPGWTIDIFDVKPALRRMPLTLLLNLFFLARENGVNLLAGRLTLWQAFFTTTYLFKRMSSIARRWVQQGDYAPSVRISSTPITRISRISATPISIHGRSGVPPGWSWNESSTGTRRGYSRGVATSRPR